jgi:hypothetical protein
MTAPLPMRFFNPIKDLCQRVNLDYETVIAAGGLSTTMRNALVNAEIPKPIQEYTDEEKKIVKLKIREYNDKYGVHGRDVEITDGKVEVRDKGRERYDMGISVEYICADDSKVDESASVSNSKEDVADSRFTKDGIKYLAPINKWVPGKPC